MPVSRKQEENAETDVGALTQVLAALSDPLRLEIVRRLDAHGPMSCRDLGLDVPLPTLSRHLNILREAGIVLTVPDGTRRLNSLRREELQKRFPGVFSSVLALARRPVTESRSRSCRS